MGRTKTVEHSINFEKVRNYHKRNLWNLERVIKAVGKWITEAEYIEITGQDYPGKE